MAGDAEIERDEEVTSVEVSVPAVFEENEWAQVRLADTGMLRLALRASAQSLPDLAPPDNGLGGVRFAASRHHPVAS